jgi:hypothetical protein
MNLFELLIWIVWGINVTGQFSWLVLAQSFDTVKIFAKSADLMNMYNALLGGLMPRIAIF